MSAITASQTRMDEKFAQFQGEIRQCREEAAAKALKHAWYDKPYIFRKRGDEEQASFNAKVDKALTQAESDLAAVTIVPASTPTIRRVKESIQKGRSLLEARQKLILHRRRNDCKSWGAKNFDQL